MQIRTAILVAGTTLALAAPATAAGVPSHRATAPTTEHSYGQSKPSANVNALRLKAKAKAKKAAHAAHVVTIVVEPMIPVAGAVAGPDPNACQSTMTDCTDEQLCELWGANCDVWAADQAAPAQTAAADEQQPSSD